MKQYSIKRVNTFTLWATWIIILVLAIAQYFVRYNVMDCVLFYIISSAFFVIPTIIWFYKPSSNIISVWVILGSAICIQFVTYLQNGLFDDTYYLCLCIVATSVYFNFRLTVFATSYISISSCMLYIFFKPYFFPAFAFNNFCALILAFISIGVVVSVQTIWSKQLVQNETILYERAIHDRLTGLYNRSYYEDVFYSKINEAEKSKNPLSIIIIDIDNFKRINDEFGHSQGDLVLKEVARRIQSAARKTDIVTRIGGEEFVVILDGALLKEASSVAEKIRIEIYKEKIINHDISVSLGVAQYNNEKSSQAFFDRADSALYKAKNSGKNRVEVST